MKVLRAFILIAVATAFVCGQINDSAEQFTSYTSLPSDQVAKIQEFVDEVLKDNTAFAEAVVECAWMSGENYWLLVTAADGVSASISLSLSKDGVPKLESIPQMIPSDQVSENCSVGPVTATSPVNAWTKLSQADLANLEKNLERTTTVSCIWQQVVNGINYWVVYTLPDGGILTGSLYLALGSDKPEVTSDFERISGTASSVCEAGPPGNSAGVVGGFVRLSEEEVTALEPVVDQTPIVCGFTQLVDGFNYWIVGQGPKNTGYITRFIITTDGEFKPEGGVVDIPGSDIAIACSEGPTKYQVPAPIAPSPAPMPSPMPSPSPTPMPAPMPAPAPAPLPPSQSFTVTHITGALVTALLILC